MAPALLEAAPDAVVVIDADARIVMLNREAERLLGCERDVLRGQPFDAVVEGVERWFDKGPTRGTEASLRRADGSQVTVELSLAPVDVRGEVLGIAVLRDLTERKRLDAELRFQSTHDALTGLLNRRAFDAAVLHLSALETPVVAVMIDLDALKSVNDQQGHAAGDALLQRAAQVLRSLFRAEDVVARLGGDEFGVLTAGRDVLPEMLLERLQQGVDAHNRDCAWPLRLSWGVAVAPGGEVRRALETADARMYAMKRQHR